jgi:hypothetical protein
MNNSNEIDIHARAGGNYMEGWLASNWYLLLTIIGLVFVGYWRLGKVENDLKDHLDKDNKAPHPACPVHGVKFDELISAISDVRATVKLLDTRIYDFMRSNGYKDRAES